MHVEMLLWCAEHQMAVLLTQGEVVTTNAQAVYEIGGPMRCSHTNDNQCEPHWTVTARPVRAASGPILIHERPKEVSVNDTSQKSEPFGPKELMEYSRLLFVSNECESDEYRETQPWKLITTVGDLATQFPNFERHDELWNLFRDWILHHGPWYEGAEQARPIYEMIHDVWWVNGRHMYYDNVEQLKEEIGQDEDRPKE
jgi:hypothetical protein